ncbi:MAG: hypothetical protein ACTHNY_02940, partial [Solirubrobacterales bacterium]
MLETISTFTLGQVFDIFPTELASPTRDSFVYETYAGPQQDPPGPNGAFDLYQAEREGSGWRTTRRLSRSATALTWPLPGGVSSDHTYSFTNEGMVDYLGGPSGTFELTGLGSLGEEPNAQGRYITGGGTHIIFTTGDKEGQSGWCNGCPVLQLEPDAAPTGTGTVYDREADGKTRVVSLLPGEVPQKPGQEAFYKGTSKDATATAFEIEGILYVRVDNSETREVASGVTFAGLSDDGDKLFYLTGGTTHAGNIHRFDTSSGQDVAVNSSADAEVVNVSADGSHVYFVSPSQLDGVEGEAGQPNLYVWSSGSIDYIATVEPSDLEQTSGELTGVPALANWTKWVTTFPNTGGEQGPGAESSRTTPDGTALVFESRGQLTSDDGDNYTDIYRYDDLDNGLICVSCSTSAAAIGEARLQEVHLIGPPIVIHNLSADGSRVFFETPDSLVSADINNGVNDVYEWQELGGGGGSIDLISSGKSLGYPLPQGWESPFAPLPNLLLGVTPDASDVFFTAKEALVPGAAENGTQAIYDARVGGGFPSPAMSTPCAEEACHAGAQGAAPSFLVPRSEVNAGGGNVKPRKRHRCRRARAGHKHRKHRRCSKRHKKASARSSAGLSSTVTGGGDAEAPAAEAPSSSAPRAAMTPVAAAASPIEAFGIETLEAKLSTPEAGAHPDFTTNIVLNHFQNNGFEDASASAEELSISLPPGLLGNPNSVPACSMGDFVSFGNCSSDAQVGVTRVRVGNPLYTTAEEPVYNLTPPHPDREVARLGFIAYLYPVFVDVKVRTASDYGVTAVIHSAPGLGALVRAKTTLWGDPSGPSHNKERLTPFEAANCPLGVPCKAQDGERGSTISPADQRAFMTNPSACQGGEVGLRVTAYQLPGQVFEKTAPLDPISGCQGLPFAPTFEAEPTSHVAGAPTGLKTKLMIPQHLGPEETATATMREARVTLPEGMQIAAGAANWIGTCSEAQVGYHQEVDAACPDAAKLGTATIASPALPEPLQGAIYQRDQRPGHPFGLWLVTDELGLHVKLPGELEPNPVDGRLTAVFGDLPQVPVSEIDLDVWGGPRAPLENPDACGAYTTNYAFASHSSDPAVTGASQMTIDQGCSQPFDPTLHAGTTNPVAGRFSPLVIDLDKPDEQQQLAGFKVTLPDGLLAKLRGVGVCPEAVAGSGACPADSELGHLSAAAGPGPDPLWVPQSGRTEPKVYLAGPQEGSPFSVVTAVPAQAGPFDLGTIVVRSGLGLDPDTNRAVVDIDPLPQFFEGVGLTYRHLHVVIDRPRFTLNPTDCSQMQVNGKARSTQGAVATPSSRFQVSGCKRLKFAPKLQLKLS